MTTALRAYEVTKPFEGVVRNLERRFRETESEWAREEIGAVHGGDALRGLRRLSPEAGSAGGEDRRHFHIGHASELSVRTRAQWFAALPAGSIPSATRSRAAFSRKSASG
jgi:excinuclease ABC subunit A